MGGLAITSKLFSIDKYVIRLSLAVRGLGKSMLITNACGSRRKTWCVPWTMAGFHYVEREDEALSTVLRSMCRSGASDVVLSLQISGLRRYPTWDFEQEARMRISLLRIHRAPLSTLTNAWWVSCLNIIARQLPGLAFIEQCFDLDNLKTVCQEISRQSLRKMASNSCDLVQRMNAKDQTERS